MASKKSAAKQSGFSSSYFAKNIRKKLSKGIEHGCKRLTAYCESKTPTLRRFEDLSEDEQQKAIAIWCEERGLEDATAQLRGELRSFFRQIGGTVTSIELSPERCVAQVSLDRNFKLVADVWQPGNRRNCSAEFDDFPFPSKETCFVKASSLWARRAAEIDELICEIDDLCIDACQAYGNSGYRISATIARITKDKSVTALRLWKSALNEVLNECLDECVEQLEIIDQEDFYFFIESNDEVYFNGSYRMV